MKTVASLYQENKDFFHERKVQNIIPLCGNGILKDDSPASSEFRYFLEIIPTDLLIKYTKDCLSESFAEGGFALQDILNQLGRRLNYDVEYGLYKGRKNEIGFDGIWTGKDGYKLIIEVKTTDAYRINLDTLRTYKDKLQEKGVIGKDSSILIIVGRQDTGDLEAQIRGSKHAWDIRLISTDAIIDLLNMRETVNDARILQQINEVLKPLEFTRLDKLVKLLFLTSQDQAGNEISEEAENIIGTEQKKGAKEEKQTPMKFHDLCIERINKLYGKQFIKLSKSTYESNDKTTGISLAVSKTYLSGNTVSYWYSFHTYQEDFLKDYKNSYACFGCGDENTVIIIPAAKFIELKKNFTTTTKGERTYWHVWIFKKDETFELGQPRGENKKRIKLDKYLNSI
jgi:hypothetical protein